MKYPFLTFLKIAWDAMHLKNQVAYKKNKRNPAIVQAYYSYTGRLPSLRFFAPNRCTGCGQQGVKKMFAPLEFIFIEPSHHRVHHATNLEYPDRNHAGILII